METGLTRLVGLGERRGRPAAGAAAAEGRRALADAAADAHAVAVRQLGHLLLQVESVAMQHLALRQLASLLLLQRLQHTQETRHDPKQTSCT